mmetsp:Transcript_21840/g.22206  ORF Transcript_21840/g.22206 Transcript_21840/m.22206 type:complete len:142 (-) Transcript_21840:8-433(-)
MIDRDGCAICCSCDINSSCRNQASNISRSFTPSMATGSTIETNISSIAITTKKAVSANSSTNDLVDGSGQRKNQLSRKHNNNSSNFNTQERSEWGDPNFLEDNFAPVAQHNATLHMQFVLGVLESKVFRKNLLHDITSIAG